MEPSQRTSIRVAIVEDQRDIREGLTTLINSTSGYQCTGAYRSMEEGLEGIRRNMPDIALCDIGLPGMSGIEGIRILKERHPQLQLMMLTIYDDDDRIFDALCAGACGYLLKRTSPKRLLESLSEAASGGAPMSPEEADYELTPHETRLLKLIVQGHNYTTAAEELGVSYNTVKFHMRRIYEKLQVHSKSEAVAKALRDHIID